MAWFSILIYDLYPHAPLPIYQSGMVLMWQFINKLSWKIADNVVAISEKMAVTIKKDCFYGTSVTVIPTWVDTKTFLPLKNDDNWFRKSLLWDNRTVVMYSGNLGRTHDLHDYINAIECLKEDVSLGFVFIGGGEGFDEVSHRIQSAAHLRMWVFTQCRMTTRLRLLQRMCL